MASDFETVVAKCDGCKYEEECREMPPCILDAYNKGRSDAFNEILSEMRKSPFANEKTMFVKKYIEGQLKGENND